MYQVRKRNLLVVDDDPVNRMVMGKYLENEGHQVFYAINGYEALQVLGLKSVDMVLLDIVMPEMNGYQVLEQVVADPVLRDIPVIVISAIEHMDSVVRCIEMGAEDYLTKPINRVLLKARLDVCLEKKRLRDQQTAHLRRLEREMEIARQTQLSILPEELPQVTGYRLGALMIPARAVGGDFYDVIDLGGQQWGIVIGDVSGKGLPAALFMTLTYSLLRMEAAHHIPPGQALVNVNQTLLGMNSASMFVTVLCGILDAKEGSFSYARAGHPQPMIISSGGDVLDNPMGSSQAIGLFEDLQIDEQTVKIPPGGVVLLYSDGLSEATDSADRQFGEERLPLVLRDLIRQEPQAMCEGLWEEAQLYCGVNPQQDDFTLVVIKSVNC
ncbi:MAG: SpoIIE family protein phosphatase [Brevefilum sp.]|nr:SpoIIE family protein phosphatase [Brevefilum sp.]